MYGFTTFIYNLSVVTSNGLAVTGACQAGRYC
jgi:hypothetical protein